MTQDQCQWWVVKVYDPQSKTTTTLSRFAKSAQEIEDNWDSEYWTFIEAYPEE